MKYTFEIYDAVWRKWYGSSKTAYDPFGKKIIFKDYGKNKLTGWEIAHIWPLESQGKKKSGANTYGNVVPMQYQNSMIKLNKTSGIINNMEYDVRIEEYHNQRAVGTIYVNNEPIRPKL